MVQGVLDGGQRGVDALSVGHVALVVQRHVEVNADEDALTLHVNVGNGQLLVHSRTRGTGGDSLLQRSQEVLCGRLKYLEFATDTFATAYSGSGDTQEHQLAIFRVVLSRAIEPDRICVTC